MHGQFVFLQHIEGRAERKYSATKMHGISLRSHSPPYTLHYIKFTDQDTVVLNQNQVELLQK